MGVNYYKGLGDVAIDAGLELYTEPGASTRGHGGMGDIRSVIIHHTAGSWNKSNPADYNSRTTILKGNTSTPGPLSQYGIGRVTGKVYWFASGLCAHAGRDTQVLAVKYRNEHAIGIEIENNGLGEPYGTKTYESAVALTGQLVIEFGLNVDTDVVGHKEIALTAQGKLGRKTDPSFNMDHFRTAVKMWIKNKTAVVNTPAAPQKTWLEELMMDEKRFMELVRTAVLTTQYTVQRSGKPYQTNVKNGLEGADGAQNAIYGVVLALQAELAGLKTAVAQLAAHEDVDGEAILASIKKAVQELVPAEITVPLKEK